MSELGGTCEYVLDPDDPNTWGGEEGEECYVDEEVLNEDGVWTCPHNAEEGEDLCIFHLPVKEKDGLDELFLATLEETADRDDPDMYNRGGQFLGAKFDEFNIADHRDTIDEKRKIDLSYARFKCEFNCSQIVFDTAGLHFMGAKFSDSIDFTKSEFKCKFSCEDAVFREEAAFSTAKFKEDADFKRVKFNSHLDFQRALFKKEALFVRAKFHSTANFSNTAFEGDLIFFWQSDFTADAYFKECNFRGETNFRRVKFGSDADFGGRINNTGARFDGEVDFRHTSFKGNANFEKTHIKQGGDFGNSYFNEDVIFSNSDLSDSNFEESHLSGVDFSDSTIQNAVFKEAHLENADFDGADLTGANLERAKLSNADLIGTNISGTQIHGARIGDVIINVETTFDKHGKHHCVYDPKSAYDYDPNDEEKVGQLRKAMGAYHVLEQLTRTNTLPDEQAKFFTRRQDMRRAQLREDGRRLEYWFAEAQNTIFRHGESFSRVVGWSVGTIVAFAFIFPLGGWLQSDSTGTITYRAIAESPELMWQSFYHSLLLFLTGNSPLSPVGFVGEVLTSIESLIAPILLALLIFVLGRRAAR